MDWRESIMQKHVAVFMALGCGVALACAAGRGGYSSQEGALAAAEPRRVDVEVFGDFRVSPDPVHLSKRGNHEAHWTLKEGEDKWPLEVTCDTPTHCAGKIKANGKRGSHPYRVVIGGKAGPDPVIIIEP